MSDYKPGLYRVDSWRGKDLLAFRTIRRAEESNPWCILQGDDTRGADDLEVSNVRPLVVLDLSTWLPEYVARIPAWLRDVSHAAPSESLVRALADQLEKQTRPAIEEPKGLGAVVEDTDGKRWSRSQDASRDTSTVRPWLREDDRMLAQTWSAWADLNPVRVLSEGVPA